MNEIPVRVGKEVLVYKSDKDRWVVGKVIRVYDEVTYEKEHYGKYGPNGFYIRPSNVNQKLVDIMFKDKRCTACERGDRDTHYEHIKKGKDGLSKAHFVWGLKEIG